MSGSVAHDKIEQNIFVMGSSPLKAASHISPLMHLHVNKWMDGYRFKERWHHTQHSISHFQCYTIRVQGGSKRHQNYNGRAIQTTKVCKEITTIHAPSLNYQKFIHSIAQRHKTLIRSQGILEATSATSQPQDWCTKFLNILDSTMKLRFARRGFAVIWGHFLMGQAYHSTPRTPT